MSLLGIPVLSFILFSPLAGIGILLLVPKENKAAIRWIGFAVSLIPFLLSLLLVRSFDRGNPSFQFVERHDWIPAMVEGPKPRRYSRIRSLRASSPVTAGSPGPTHSSNNR